MNPKWHFLLSSVIALISLWFDQSFPFLNFGIFGYNLTIAVLCIAIGVGIDADHLVDYHVYGWHSFGGLEDQFRNDRLLVVFHGIENIPILLLLSLVFPFLVFPVISYVGHMLMDVAGNAGFQVSLQAYSYLIRFGGRVFK